jgi:hypothetical protein
MVRAECGNTEGSPNPSGSTRNQPLQLGPQRAPKRTNFKPSGTFRNKAIAKEVANRSAHQIQYVIVVIVNLLSKVYFASLTP